MLVVCDERREDECMYVSPPGGIGLGKNVIFYEITSGHKVVHILI